MNKRGCWQPWYPLALWIVAIPILLLTPDAEAVGWLERRLEPWSPALLLFLETWGDKFVHALLFAMGAFLFHRAGLRLLPALVASALYGAAMEGAQFAFPPRSPDALDALANAVGSGLYGLLVLGTRRWQR